MQGRGCELGISALSVANASATEQARGGQDAQQRGAPTRSQLLLKKSEYPSSQSQQGADWRKPFPSHRPLSNEQVLGYLPGRLCFWRRVPAASPTFPYISEYVNMYLHLAMCITFFLIQKNTSARRWHVKLTVPSRIFAHWWSGPFIYTERNIFFAFPQGLSILHLCKLPRAEYLGAIC